MKLKIIKYPLSMFFTLLVASILCFQIVHAGIYRVVVLRSPDGKQRVRLYFDHHDLGLQEDYGKQFEIIQKAVESLKAQKNSFTILVESPAFYQAFAQEFPEEQDWVLVQSQSITSEAIAAGLGEGQPKRSTDFSSLLFSLIPRMGSMLKASDMNVHIISIDARNLLINFMRFVKDLYTNCSMLQESLDAVYKKTFEQINASKIVIPAKESLISGQQTGHIPVARAFSSEYQAKINELFQKLNTDFESQMFAFRKSVGDAVWNCNIFTQMEKTTPGIDRNQKCKNYFETYARYWDVPCFQNKEDEIGRFLDASVSGEFSLYYLEYDVLQYILNPVAPNEIAVFVGGSHGERIESILKDVNYTTIYENGYSLNETLGFEKILNPYQPADLKKGLLLYSPENSQIINHALQETLVAGPMPSFTQIAVQQEQNRRFLEKVYEKVLEYHSVLDKYGKKFPLSDKDKKRALAHVAHMKQRIKEFSQYVDGMTRTKRAHENESGLRVFNRVTRTMKEFGYAIDAFEQILEKQAEKSEVRISEQRGKRMGGNGQEYEDESSRKKIRTEKLEQTVEQVEVQMSEASISEQKGKRGGGQDADFEDEKLRNKARTAQAAMLIQAGVRGGLARREQCKDKRKSSGEYEDENPRKKARN